MFTSSDTMNSDPQKVSFGTHHYNIHTYTLPPAAAFVQDRHIQPEFFIFDAVFTPMASLSSTGQEWCTTLATAEVLLVVVESLVVQVVVCKRHIQPLVEIHVSNIGGNCQ